MVFGKSVLNRLLLLCLGMICASGETNEGLRNHFDELVSRNGISLTDAEREEYFANFSHKLKVASSPLTENEKWLESVFEKSRPAILSSFVSFLNEKKLDGLDWVAEVSPRFNMQTISEARVLMGTFVENYERLDELEESLLSVTAEELPENFDASEKWPECKTIRTIRDQSGCGSCWAFSSTESMNDRLCIASNGKFQGVLSTQHTTSCCGPLKCMSFGCNGGQPTKAWQWFATNGVVTGGGFDSLGSEDTCWPYEMPPCNHHSESAAYGPCPTGDSTPRCRRDCLEKKYPLSFRADTHKAERAFSIGGRDKIKREIFEYGPVSAAFIVHEDFLTYKSGVYSYKSGSQLGGHAVKIIGWGKEDDEDYWLVVNSWNDSWGDKGTFKIKMGEKGIDDMVSAGRVSFNNRMSQATSTEYNHGDVDIDSLPKSLIPSIEESILVL